MVWGASLSCPGTPLLASMSRALRHGLSDTCRQSSGRIEAAGYTATPSLRPPTASRLRFDQPGYSSERHHGVTCLSKISVRFQMERCKPVKECLNELFLCGFIQNKISHTITHSNTLENSPTLIPRQRWSEIRKDINSGDIRFRRLKVSNGKYNSTSVTLLSSSLHFRAKMLLRSHHLDIPKAMQISGFCTKPAPETEPQRHPKDTASTPDALPSTAPSVLSQQPRPKGIVGYIISRYTWYIERLQRSLESEMPRTFHMFRIFSVGLKAFIKDFTGYVRVLVQLSFPSERLERLTLHQLQLYHFMPYDMFKVFPVLAISAVPFGQNLALPLGYFFPRQLLCRHFWDLQQSHDFAMRDLRKRVLYARPVFRCLQASVAGIEPLSARVQMQSACHLLGSGRHPRDAQVMELRELFSAAPYSLKTISRHHVHSLLRLHGLSAILSRKRLRDHARWLLCHDWAMTAEARGLPPNDTALPGRGAAGDSLADGGDQSPLLQCDLAALHVNDLKTSLLLRGISPIGLDSSGMARVLERWLAVSLKLTAADSSLLLHLPILLFYNHPTNMALISR